MVQKITSFMLLCGLASCSKHAHSALIWCPNIWVGAFAGVASTGVNTMSIKKAQDFLSSSLQDQSAISPKKRKSSSVFGVNAYGNLITNDITSLGFELQLGQSKGKIDLSSSLVRGQKKSASPSISLLSSVSLKFTNKIRCFFLIGLNWERQKYSAKIDFSSIQDQISPDSYAEYNGIHDSMKSRGRSSFSPMAGIKMHREIGGKFCLNASFYYIFSREKGAKINSSVDLFGPSGYHTEIKLKPTAVFAVGLSRKM
jgi:hypothetical protein